MKGKLVSLATAIREVFWPKVAQSGVRQAQLLAQYHRARRLPRDGFQIWRNRTDASNPAADISILITCFDYGAVVQNAVHSVLSARNSGPNLELIVVDDASTDNSNSVLLRLLSQAPIPMLVIRPWWNVGLSCARNIGLSQSRSDYVFVLDADNTVEPDGLERLFAAARRTGAAAAYGPIRKIAPDGSRLGMLSDEPFDPQRLRIGNYIDAMALFSRRALVGIGGYDIELLRVIGGWEDYAVWLEFANRGLEVAFEPTTIGTYTAKPNSMVERITREEAQAAMQLFRDRYGFPPNLDDTRTRV